MPGIIGIISQLPGERFSQSVNAMVDIMACEDFYKTATHFISEAGVYTGFVGFDNSVDGIFSDEDEKTVLIFSGECFIGSELATGEKLIRMYDDEGIKFVEKLNGLFCGLLIDRERQKIFLFNDRYGIRRIYFHEKGGDFYFASEAKALLRILPELREFNPEGVADFLAFGCTLDGKTLFKGIEILPGGSIWSFEGGNCRKEKYFSPQIWESQPQLAPDDYENRFQETFRRILPRYFESSSEIGIALTGGLDTRMIMACRPRNGNRPVCYTFSGAAGETLDDKIAARIAAASNLEHKLLRLDADFFLDFPAHADKTIFATDGCAGICNSHEIYFNRKARQMAPVRLTGNYGSEILRGISTFKPVPLSPQLFNPDWRAKINSRPEKLSAHKAQPMTFAAFKEIPWNLFGNLAAGWSQVQFRTPYLDNELVALAFQAPEPVRKSSLPSFRLVRANNRALSEIPTDRGFAGRNSGPQFWSRRLFAEVTFKLDYYNNEGLPHALASFDPLLKTAAARLGIVGLHKFLHYRSWFQDELAGYVSENLARAQARLNDFWDPGFLKKMAAEHIGGKKNYSLEINAVLTLEAVERLLFHELPREIAAAT